MYCTMEEWNRNMWHRVIRSPFAVIPLGLITLWLFVAAARVHIEAREAERQVRELEERIAKGKEENDLLSLRASRAYDPAFLERQARLRLNVQAEGEEVVFVHLADEERPASASAGGGDGIFANLRAWLYDVFR